MLSVILCLSKCNIRYEGVTKKSGEGCKRTSFSTFTLYSFFLGLLAIRIPLKEQVPQLYQGKLICLRV